MHDALIGSSGFVGGTLGRQAKFAKTFRASNIGELAGQRFDTLYCAGAPGQKWLANQEPEADAQNLETLCAALRQVQCARLVLLSTVDVFAAPQEVTETSDVDPGAQGYGRNRRNLELFVQQHFARSLIVRLPGLVGPGLRKNALYDLAHRRRLDALRGDAVFQFYPTDHLWADIQTALAHKLSCIHLTAEPTSLQALAQAAFDQTLPAGNAATPAPRYDMRSHHAALWGKTGPYQYDRQDVLAAVRAYAQQVRAQVRANDGSVHATSVPHPHAPSSEQAAP